MVPAGVRDQLFAGGSHHLVEPLTTVKWTDSVSLSMKYQKRIVKLRFRYAAFDPFDSISHLGCKSGSHTVVGQRIIDLGFNYGRIARNRRIINTRSA
jgi:hypothetical protein